MAKGFIKVGFVENGISVQTHLEEVDFFDKIMLLNGVFDELGINTDDGKEVGMYCALAASIPQNSKVKVDVGTIKKAAEMAKGQEDDIGDEDEG